MSQEKSKHSKNLFFKFLKICFLCFGFVTFVPAAYSVSLGRKCSFFHYFPNFAVRMWTSKLLIQVFLEKWSYSSIRAISTIELPGICGGIDIVIMEFSSNIISI